MTQGKEILMFNEDSVGNPMYFYEQSDQECKQIEYKLHKTFKQKIILNDINNAQIYFVNNELFDINQEEKNFLQNMNVNQNKDQALDIIIVINGQIESQQQGLLQQIEQRANNIQHEVTELMNDIQGLKQQSQPNNFI